jgi:lipopolysaccharide transport system ATP-binding protein
MSKEAIRVDGLGKRYEIGTSRNYNPTLRDAVAAQVETAFGWIGKRSAPAAPTSPSRAFWALRDVSFAVEAGEVVGVVGANGAGKTTLLKILSRITEPTEGLGVVRGRVGSLLEVGTGFHPELTGRENVYLNGVIIGMTRAEVARRYDEIVAFSGVERFIDTPVKRYSSGMYLRLAFSVAAHLQCEIVLVDEVLAVGDAEFQKKCMGKIGDVARSGRTVVFVSHNLTAVQALCSRALYLKEGKLVGDGDPRGIVTDYLGANATHATERVWEGTERAPKDGIVRLRRACVRPEGGVAGDPIDVRTSFVIEVDYRNEAEDAVISLSLLVLDEGGIVVFNAGPVTPPRPLRPGVYRDTCHVPGDLMNDGAYRVDVEIQFRGETVLPPTEILTFQIADSPDFRTGWYGKWLGAVRPMLAWRTSRIDEVDLRGSPTPSRRPRVSKGTKQ